ncbi:UbiA prenyltransferase family protein [Streptomyces europaeiscabiei]|uniref:hypothetical protein n=1 Tax=Streptomyces europaeiscabiei TaxID=146819 RepID=UPI0029A20817|nr:hypothetical protein [Streptomyces europaeiscabiei]MDX2762746.1 hypothetical protein [Streptomyces europaeiscabiei]
MPIRGVPTGEERRFDVLALDYQMAREDERTFANIQTAVASIAVVLLGAMATVGSDTCELSKHAGCKHVPRLILAGAPAIPLAALAFVQLLGMVSALRSYYIRAVESELRAYAPGPLPELAPVAPISPASYHGLITEVTTLRRGRTGYRILATMIMIVALAAFGGLTVYIAIQLGGWYRNLMLLSYGSVFALLISDVVGGTFGARSTFVQVALKFRARQIRPLLSGETVSGRSLTSYLLLPRPEDWIKWLFVPGAYLLASLVERKSLNGGMLALTVLITEYLVYSARYQWNDIRGMKDDALHPQSAARLRLPSSRDKGQRRFIVGSSLVVAVLRLVTAIVLGVVVGEASQVLILVGSVFGVALVYEFLRTAESFHLSERVRDLVAVLLWLIVGSGYALRFLVGVYVAGVSLSSELAASGAVFMFTFGVMFVLLTWTLEASSYCYRHTGILANPISDEVRPSWYTDGRLHRKPHLMLLLVPHADVREGWAGRQLLGQCGDDPVLKSSVTVRSLRDLVYWSVWNLPFWSACVTAAWLAANTRHEAASNWLLVISLAGAVSVSWPVSHAHRVVTALFYSGVIWCVAAWRGWNNFEPAGAAALLILWTLATATYLVFRLQSYHSLKNFAVGLRAKFTNFGRGSIKLIAGPETWRTLS